MPDLEALWRDALSLKPDDWALTLTQTTADSALCTLSRYGADGHAANEAYFHRSTPHDALSEMVTYLRARADVMPL